MADSGSNRVPIASHSSGQGGAGFDSGSNSVPIRFQFGSNSVPIRFQFGSNSIPVLFQSHCNPIPIRLQLDSNSTPARLQLDSNSTPTRLQSHSCRSGWDAVCSWPLQKPCWAVRLTDRQASNCEGGTNPGGIHSLLVAAGYDCALSVFDLQLFTLVQRIQFTATPPSGFIWNLDL